jgi:hypothetical protein
VNEYALVRIAEQYRRKVDGMLRKILAAVYVEWEELPEGEGVPEGIVL